MMVVSSSSPALERPPHPAWRLLRQPWLVPSLVVVLGILLRVAILSGPLGEVEADESVVGLMALHILDGERPAFYWGQPYLGSLEAYVVAAAFALVGPSNLTLKLVPALAYLVFALLVYFGCRRDVGERPALLCLLYLALPPSFLAFWSLKARGGYVELLALGQALLFLAPWALSGGGLAWRLATIGCLAGLLLWTHILGLVYVVPVVIYLVVRLGRRLFSGAALAGLVGGLIGLGPALLYNLQHDRATIRALSTDGFSAQIFQENLASLLRVGLPVMVGLGQATTSPLLFAEDWPHRPGSLIWVPPLLLAAIAVALLPTFWCLLGSRDKPLLQRNPTALFGLAVIAGTPALASLGRFGELVAEPRYALPLYSALPLFTLALVWLADRCRPGAVLLGSLVFLVNGYSVFSADPRLNLPTSARGSTEANRAELIAALEARGIAEIHADYWLAYPLMLESRERIAAAVSSGGYDRFGPFVHLVASSERPAWVFVRSSPEQQRFLRQVATAPDQGSSFSVSIYDVYYDLPRAASSPSSDSASGT